MLSVILMFLGEGDLLFFFAFFSLPNYILLHYLCTLHIFVFKKNNIVGSKYIFGIVRYNNINKINNSPTIKLIIQQPASQNGAG